MEHYIKHQRLEMPIGKHRILQRISYEKLYMAFQNGTLSQADGSMPPLEYLRPENRFFYRFPFPEEWLLSVGSISDWPENRGLLLRIDKGNWFRNVKFPLMGDTYMVRSQTQPDLFQVIAVDNPNNIYTTLAIEIVYQNCVVERDRIVQQLVLRCPYSGSLYVLPNQDAAQFITAQIQFHYLQPATNTTERDFWNNVIISIIRGYSGVHELPEIF